MALHIGAFELFGEADNVAYIHVLTLFCRHARPSYIWAD
jgi:hypothetical protein